MNRGSQHKKKHIHLYILFSQVASLIAELASAAAEERGLTFDAGIEERLCAYSRAVAHFPTAVKEASPAYHKLSI